MTLPDELPELTIEPQIDLTIDESFQDTPGLIPETPVGSLQPPDAPRKKKPCPGCIEDQGNQEGHPCLSDPDNYRPAWGEKTETTPKLTPQGATRKRLDFADSDIQITYQDAPPAKKTTFSCG